MLLHRYSKATLLSGGTTHSPETCSTLRLKMVVDIMTVGLHGHASM